MFRLGENTAMYFIIENSNHLLILGTIDTGIFLLIFLFSLSSLRISRRNQHKFVQKGNVLESPQ